MQVNSLVGKPLTAKFGGEYVQVGTITRAAFVEDGRSVYIAAKIESDDLKAYLGGNEIKAVVDVGT